CTKSFPKQQRLRCSLIQTTSQSPKSSRETWRRARAALDWKLMFYVPAQNEISTESSQSSQIHPGPPPSLGLTPSWPRSAEDLPVWAYNRRCRQSLKFGSLLWRAG